VGLDDLLASGVDPTTMLVVPRLPSHAPGTLSVAGQEVFNWVLWRQTHLMVFLPHQIVEEYGMSHSTVQRALKEIEDGGHATVTRGKAYKREGGGWDNMSHTIRLLPVPEPISLGELGWERELMLEGTKGRGRSFRTRELAEETARAASARTVMRTCDCGCGRNLMGSRRQFFYGPACRQRYFKAKKRAEARVS
jgi:hypothetical protein